MSKIEQSHTFLTRATVLRNQSIEMMDEEKTVRVVRVYEREYGFIDLDLFDILKIGSRSFLPWSYNAPT